MSNRVARLIVSLLKDVRKQEIIENQTLRVEVDFEIASGKPEFNQVVRDMQSLMLDKMEKGNGLLISTTPQYIELGAGVIPMSKLDSRIKSTDIVPTAHLNGVLDATDLDIEDSTVSGFFLQNTFHHIPDPIAFFEETSRVLTPGGRIVILDPYFNGLSKWLYPRLFKTEDFDMEGSWKGTNFHAMIGANQALSYIVFVRDREYFESTFPELRIVEKLPVYFGFRYILTGGLNFRKIAPGFIFSLVRKLERFPWLFYFFAIHWIIVVEKRVQG
jgi:SAM-dependent methyltransferase